MTALFASVRQNDLHGSYGGKWLEQVLCPRGRTSASPETWRLFGPKLSPSQCPAPWPCAVGCSLGPGGCCGGFARVRSAECSTRPAQNTKQAAERGAAAQPSILTAGVRGSLRSLPCSRQGTARGGAGSARQPHAPRPRDLPSLPSSPLQRALEKTQPRAPRSLRGARGFDFSCWGVRWQGRGNKGNLGRAACVVRVLARGPVWESPAPVHAARPGKP